MSRRLRRADREAADRTTGARDPRALACLVLGLLVLAGALALALSDASPRRTGTNGVWPQFSIGGMGPGERACQAGELLPAGTDAIQLVLQPAQASGPRVRVTLRRKGEVLDRSSGLVTASAGGTTTVPLRPLARDVAGVEVCFELAGAGTVAVVGGPTLPTSSPLVAGGRRLEASIPITYMRSGARSWWQQASTVAERMDLGRGNWGGGWVAWVLATLMLASVALVVSILLRAVVADGGEPPAEARGRGPRLSSLAGTVTAVAVLNAAAWSLITPAFEVPDEQTHVAYAQEIAEAGRPPLPDTEDRPLAPALTAAMAGARFGAGEDARSYKAAVWSPLEQSRLTHELHASPAGDGDDFAGPSAPEPPLYYMLEAVPYELASGATLLDRMMLMRLLSAAMAGATALFVLLFLRECLPGRPWAWTVGALGAALSPTLGFVSGGVNPDALLFPVCAALFYVLAVAFRRGLTTRLAVWIGVVLALGVISKINFYGLLPGALLAVALAARTSAGGVNRQAARLVGIVVGIAVAPYLLLTALDALVWDRTFILARTPAETPQDHGGLGGQLSYLWQVFLPRLPGMTDAFPEYYPGYQLWLKGFVGKFGWTVVQFADWAYRLAAVLLGVVVALAARTALREQVTLRTRRAELLGYATIAGGLLLLIGMVALRGWAPGVSGAVQGRYVLPLLALFGGLLVLASRGAGERWGRAVGVAIVLTCVAWSLFAQLLTISWFYG